MTAAARQQPAGDVLEERDPTLAARADQRAQAHGLTGVRIVVGDAGDPRAYAEVLPVDLLLLCGILGNVARRDIETTVAAVPALVAPGGSAVWTCGAAEPDLRPAIRRLFTGAGVVEVSFDGHPKHFGVGVALLPADAPAASAPVAGPPVHVPPLTLDADGQLVTRQVGPVMNGMAPSRR